MVSVMMVTAIPMPRCPGDAPGILLSNGENQKPGSANTSISNIANIFVLRPSAPLRPKGFYFSKFRQGERFQHLTVTEFRKRLGPQDTGCGPEGFQLLTITHPHWASLMNSRQIMFMTFADYDVAPYGYGDFFDAPQMFCSNDTLGLGIGHVDRNYPLFGMPTLRL